MSAHPVRQKAIKVAQAVHAGDRDAEVAARQDLKVAKLDAAIRAEVEKWPPLTPEQSARLAHLLLAGAAR